MVNVQTLKGFRDFLPQEARKREYVLNTLKKVFALYGFEPLETPSLEYEEILTGKYGDEGDKLMYKFKDKGERNVALRYDQTVPLARVVAQYQNDLPMPFKRYQIQNVWRAENTQKGRYREFLQVDLDTVGSNNILADLEILSLIYNAYKKLGFNIKILINDRSKLSDIENKYLTSIDKVGKIEDDEIIKEMEAKGLSIDEAEKTFNQVKNMEEPESIKEIKKLFTALSLPVDALQFRSVLVRGLDYYTGLIFEVIPADLETKLSLGGGGRYDNLIGVFAGRDIPAVGFAFGFDRIIEAMDELNLFPKELYDTKVLVTNTNETKALEITSTLRENNINTEVYLDQKDLEKQLKYADKKQIPYVILIEENNLILKNMRQRTQENLSLEEIIKRLN